MKLTLSRLFSTKSLRVFVALVACLWLCPGVVSWAMAGQPVVSRLVVTDASPLSFSVVWIASEPSTCSLLLFNERHQKLADAKILSESGQHLPAEDLGVMKVRVNNLRPDTTYYIKTVTTSKSDGKITVYPEKPIPVRTEKSAVPVDNTILAQKIYFKDHITGDGCLLLVTVEGGSSPVSGWVGGQPNPPTPWTLADLNNVYSALSHQNLQLKGGETINVEVIGGLRGYAKFTRKLPPPSPKSIFVELGPPIFLSNPQVAAVDK